MILILFVISIISFISLFFLIPFVFCLFSLSQPFPLGTAHKTVPMSLLFILAGLG